jgi:uncharacterized membrane protein
LVVSDVLETLTKNVDEYSFESLAKIGAVATFRTVLAYMLGRETREIEEQLEKDMNEESEMHENGKLKKK